MGNRYWSRRLTGCVSFAFNNEMALLGLESATVLGVDVGYSLTRATTGVAWMTPSEVGARKVTTDELSRLRTLPGNLAADLIALDGPLVPNQHLRARQVEARFARGSFQRRCKPGFSHFGQGLLLRHAAYQAAQTFAKVGRRDRSGILECNIVEAFPNAFLGVLIPDDVFQTMPPLKRGRKFDWLYDRAIENRRFEVLFEYLQLRRTDLLNRCLGERDHERRAALVCVLTAACALTGKAHVVGDEDGGSFWLPPTELWQAWALEAL